MQPVTFCTMTSYSELSNESAGNYWIVRFGNDGRISYWRNMTQVERLPVTELTKQLEYCAQELQHQIRAYQVEKDEQTREFHAERIARPARDCNAGFVKSSIKIGGTL